MFIANFAGRPLALLGTAPTGLYSTYHRFDTNSLPAAVFRRGKGLPPPASHFPARDCRRRPLAGVKKTGPAAVTATGSLNHTVPGGTSTFVTAWRKMAEQRQAIEDYFGERGEFMTADD